MRSYHAVRQYPHKPTKADPWPTVQYASRFDSAMMKYLTIQDSTATSVWRLWNFVRVLQLCKIQSRNREIVLVDTLASGISPPLPPTVTCLPWTSTYDTLVSITTVIRSTVSTDLDYKFKLRLHLLGVTFSAKNKGAITNCHEQLELEREFGHQNASYITPHVPSQVCMLFDRSCKIASLLHEGLDSSSNAARLGIEVNITEAEEHE